MEIKCFDRLLVGIKVNRFSGVGYEQRLDRNPTKIVNVNKTFWSNVGWACRICGYVNTYGKLNRDSKENYHQQSFCLIVNKIKPYVCNGTVFGYDADDFEKWMLTEESIISFSEYLKWSFLNNHWYFSNNETMIINKI